MNPLRGILLKLCSATMLVIMAALIKATADVIPPGQAVFARSVVGIPVVFAWLAMLGQLKGGIRVISPLGHAVRGFVGTLGMGCTYAALGYLPLPEVQTITFLSPVLIVVFAALLLGERLRLFRMGAVALGFLGVLIVIWPRLNGVPDSAADKAALVGVALALTAAVSGALAQVAIRSLATRERTSAIVFWFSISSVVFSLLTLPFGWVIPGPREVMLLVAAGIAGGIGQILMTSSYRHADAAVIAPFEYFSIFVAVAIGYVVFDELPTVQIVIGGALVIAAGGLIIWREHRLGLERKRQLQAGTPPV